MKERATPALSRRESASQCDIMKQVHSFLCSFLLPSYAPSLTPPSLLPSFLLRFSFLLSLLLSPSHLVSQIITLYVSRVPLSFTFTLTRTHTSSISFFSLRSGPPFVAVTGFYHRGCGGHGSSPLSVLLPCFPFGVFDQISSLDFSPLSPFLQCSRCSYLSIFSLPPYLPPPAPCLLPLLLPPGLHGNPESFIVLIALELGWSLEEMCYNNFHVNHDRGSIDDFHSATIAYIRKKLEPDLRLYKCAKDMHRTQISRHDNFTTALALFQSADFKQMCEDQKKAEKLAAKDLKDKNGGKAPGKHSMAAEDGCVVLRARENLKSATTKETQEMKGTKGKGEGSNEETGKGKGALRTSKEPAAKAKGEKFNDEKEGEGGSKRKRQKPPRAQITLGDAAIEFSGAA